MENYQPLESSGAIPKRFLALAAENYQRDAASISSTDKRYIRALKDDFFRKSNYSLNKLLLSGKVLYGDPITQYVNQVADELLKDRPELREKVEFYTYKSSSVNAVCTSKGVILITIGLMAHLTSEAQLASVLSHEIAHYEQDHVISSYVEKHAILKGKGDYSQKSFDDRVDLLYRFSQNHEYEADSLGLIRFLRSDYYVNAPVDAIDKLGYAHLPYREVPFDQSLLNVDQLIIPNSYFRDHVSPISGIEAYADDYHTHPHIDKRKERLGGILMKNLSGEKKGKQFILPKSAFEQARQHARFELIQTDLSRKSYGNAIYNAFLLLQDFPGNAYLETSIAKALYGLAKYKNADRFHEVAQAYTRVDGESQQVHYLLKKLTAKQLNTVAIKYIGKTLAKHGDNLLLDNLKQDLLRELVVTNELKLTDFYSESTDLKSDYDFYKLAFVAEQQNEHFVTEFESYYEALAQKKREENLSYREKQDRAKSKQKDYEQNGRRIFAKKVIAVDPDYWVDTRNGRDYEQSEEGEIELSELMREASSATQLAVDVLDANDFLSSDTHTYNSLSRFKLLIQDIYSHDDLPFISLFTDYTQHISEKYASEYVYYVKVYNDKADRQAFYNAILYNMNTGRIEYSSLIAASTVSMKTIKNNIQKDFITIQR